MNFKLKHFIHSVPILGLGLFTLLTSGLIAFANTTLSQGYLTQNPVQPGWLVSADPNPGIIQAANVDNADSLIGIVIGPPNALFTVTSKAGEVQVGTNGIVPAMVTNFNGDIKVGDKITASQINGVGMKVTQNAKVVGVAQGSFDAKTAGAVKTKVKDTAGKEQEMLVGQIPVLVSISYYTKGEGDRPLVPSFLQKFANAVASKEVAQLPIIISLIIFMVTIMSSFVILYSTIRSSIMSIGRNPLSRRAIVRGLLQVVSLVFALNGVGLVSIFLILKFV